MSIFEQTATAALEGFEKCPAGNHPAILVAIVDLGTRPEEFTNEKTGKTKIKDVRKVFLGWELTACGMTGSKWNFVLGREYTLSFSESAALRKMLEDWAGKKMTNGAKVNLNDFLGKKFLVSVVHKEHGEKVYANFSKASAVPSGLSVPAPKHTPFVREVTSTDPLPVWLPRIYGKEIKDVIANSNEKLGKVVPPLVSEVVDGSAEDGEETIPF